MWHSSKAYVYDFVFQKSLLNETDEIIIDHNLAVRAETTVST